MTYLVTDKEYQLGFAIGYLEQKLPKNSNDRVHIGYLKGKELKEMIKLLLNEAKDLI